MNDEEFDKISKISTKIDPNEILLFWHFTIKTIDELDIVSNPNLSVEMFLIRLMYLKNSNETEKKDINDYYESKEQKVSPGIKVIDQIKNISQENKPSPKIKSQDITNELRISSFENLTELCNVKKEIKLKYELENNVNLVSFSEGRIEISFNENLDKDFIKELSNKLYEWTNKRWIISLSKKEGSITKKQKEKKDKKNLLENAKKNKIYKKVLEIFSDAELIDVKLNESKDD